MITHYPLPIRLETCQGKGQVPTRSVSVCGFTVGSFVLSFTRLSEGFCEDVWIFSRWPSLPENKETDTLPSVVERWSVSCLSTFIEPRDYCSGLSIRLVEILDVLRPEYVMYRNRPVKLNSKDDEHRL